MLALQLSNAFSLQILVPLLYAPFLRPISEGSRNRGGGEHREQTGALADRGPDFCLTKKPDTHRNLNKFEHKVYYRPTINLMD